jgi:uncharacterized membrane protein
MPDNPDTREKQTSKPSENIEIPPIPKQTAGAVAGAAVGSIAGPIGAVVGGVAGALAGKAAEKRRGIAAAATKTVAKVAKNPKASLRQTSKRRPARKSVGKSGKTGARSRGRVKRTALRRSTTAKSRKAAGTRRRSASSRSVRKRGGGRKKRR